MLPWWSIPEAHIPPLDDHPPKSSEETAAGPMIAPPLSAPPSVEAVAADDHRGPMPAPFLYPPFPDINDGSIMETYDEPTTKTYTVNPFFLGLLRAERPERVARTHEPAPPIPLAQAATAPDDDDEGTDSPIFTPEPSPSPPPPPLELPMVLLPTTVEEPQTPSLASSPPTETPSFVLDMPSSPLPREQGHRPVVYDPWARDTFTPFLEDTDDIAHDSAEDHNDAMNEAEDDDEGDDQAAADPMPVIPVIRKKPFQAPKPVTTGQWRVGKTPGHQGSHLRAKRKAEEDSDSEDVFTSPAKVLRKPFRPPTRIAPLAPVPRATPAPSPHSLEKAVDSSPLSGATVPSSSAASSPTLHRSRTMRVGKPFVPLTPGSMPSVASRQNSGGKSRRNPDIELCNSLEAQIRTLKSALKYSSNPDEDDRVAQLVHTWRDAGREVADRLFSLLPPPAEQPAYRSEGWDWDRRGSKGGEHPESATNANLDGNPLFGDDGDDFERLLREASRPRSGTEFGIDGSHTTHRPVWHKGAMLLQLGVDPDLFGWNESEDDWDEVDDL
ncbi:uncharacterized protein LOC62_06G008452 [Vanrija pseudolonga]|uniref:Swi5-dependent recombination DNA repair protein 1 n=1 Tax=Vanrija pseudolonga TaxID=143232 RepID=A0AAF1BQK6_9TREE|nr:hypothetical protein LOC62_06G008452 [Vanrija pseudolonga]